MEKKKNLKSKIESHTQLKIKNINQILILSPNTDIL